MIRDTAASFLAEVSSPAAVRAAMVRAEGHDQQAWQRICDEMVWQALHIPESYGGMGLGYVELIALLEQMGRFLFCSPFYATVCLGANALLVAGTESQKTTYLPKIVAGSTATLAYTGSNGGWGADSIELIAAPHNGGVVLNGKCRYVPDGASAEILVVAARSKGSHGMSGVSLFVLPQETAGLTRSWLPTMDQTRRQAELVFDNVQLDSDAIMCEPGAAWPLLEKIIDLATVAIVADQVGCAQQSLDMTVSYVLQRVQFGRVIGSYQAVKHKCADMMVKAESARSALYYAACIAAEALVDGELGADLASAASAAKACGSDACFFNTGTAIQLHGGVGFTAEYDVQLYFKRAKSSETFLGDSAYHRERLAQRLLDEGAGDEINL